MFSFLLFSLKADGDDSIAYDSESAAVIHLSNDYVLYLREVSQ